MFNVNVTNQGEDVVRGFFESLRPERLDLEALAGRIGFVMLQENEAARLAGIDGEGKLIESYAPLAYETWMTRNGTGPPLVPQGELSRLIADASIEITTHSVASVTVALHWPSCPWLQYHLDGAGPGHPRCGPKWRLPKRDIAGINPAMSDAITAEFVDWLEMTVGQNGEWGMR